jgi:hypothetical protein
MKDTANSSPFSARLSVWFVLLCQCRIAPDVTAATGVARRARFFRVIYIPAPITATTHAAQCVHAKIEIRHILDTAKEGFDLINNMFGLEGGLLHVPSSIAGFPCLSAEVVNSTMKQMPQLPIASDTEERN